MSRVNTTQQSFNGGEVSPKMRGRHDLAVYYNSCERMLNFIADVQGQARYRNGTKYVTTHTQSVTTQDVRLATFVFNEEDAYVLEFTTGRIRFFRNNQTVNTYTDDPIVGFQKISGFYRIYVDSVFSAWTNGDTVHFRNITEDGYEELNDKSWDVANVTADTTFGGDLYFDVARTGTDTEAAAAVTGSPTLDLHTVVATSFTEADLPNLRFVQYGSSMYIASGEGRVQELIRGSGHTLWGFGNLTLTGTTFSTADNYPNAMALYESRLFLANTDNSPSKVWGSEAAVYTNFTLGTNDDDPFAYTLAAEKNDILHLVPYSDFLVALTLGGSYKLDGGSSEQAITPTQVKMRPIHFIGAADITPVKHGNDVVFVQKGRQKLRHLQYSFQADSYEPRDLTKMADHIFGEGCSEIAYQDGDPSLIWALRDDGQLAALTFDKEEQVMAWHRHETFLDPTTINATSITDRDRIISITTVPRPDKPDQLWMAVERTVGGQQEVFIEYMEDETKFPVRSEIYTGVEADDDASFEAKLLEAQRRSHHLDCSLIYDGSAQVVNIDIDNTGAISIETADPTFVSGDVGRFIEAKNKPGKAKITLYVNSTEVGVEILEEFTDTNLVAGEWYLSATTLSGLRHLEGHTVQVVADGNVHPDVTVTDGAITLDYAASLIQVGLGYTGVLKTMDLEGGGTNGPAQTKERNITKVGVKFLDTVGTKFGSDIYNLEDVNFRTSSDHTGRPPKAFTGEKRATFSDSWEREKHINVVQDKAQPCKVQVLVPYMTTSND